MKLPAANHVTCLRDVGYRRTCQTSNPAPNAAGDPAARTAIQAETRRIYDSAKQPVFWIVPTDPPGLKGFRDAEITGYYAGAALVRIVAGAWDSRGKYSVEYYIASRALIHVYETFEYFEDAAPRDAWRNFKRLPGWERRIYVRNGKAAYVEASGIEASGIDAARFSANLEELRAVLERLPPGSRMGLACTAHAMITGP